jgi:hypothetical protein
MADDNSAAAGMCSSGLDANALHMDALNRLRAVRISRPIYLVPALCLRIRWRLIQGSRRTARFDGLGS